MNRSLHTLLVITFCCTITTFAQVSENTKIPKGKHEYYLFITGVNSKEAVISIEKTIRSKPGVQFFLGDRFPVRYFLLVSSEVISKEQFSDWLGSNHYKLEFFGEGAEKKEELLMLRKEKEMKK